MSLNLRAEMARPTFIIAEAGVNHNGDLRRALAMVKAAAKAGADAIKFQSFHTDQLAAASAPLARYQARNTGSRGGQRAMLRRLELSEEQQTKLARVCRIAGIEFMSTPFDHDSAAFLVRKLEVKRLKVASGELTNAPLLLAMARTKKPMIVSTGMATLADIKTALGIIAFGYTAPHLAKPSRAAFADSYKSPKGKAALKKNITLLQCTTEYPTPPRDVNLRAMDTLAEAFDLPVGLSDHSQGIAIAIAAAARGAGAIEKHFTLDRDLPGPDHAASLTVDELVQMIAGIRTVEAAMGTGVKQPTRQERATMTVARKSLVALGPIKRGETFTAANLGTKRPGNGLAPIEYWAMLGRRAKRAYARDKQVKRR
ncbi:MAG: N-acetylneuraminate synthase [Rhodobacteraceae bacterium]|nr:N-acetylneuraminate synthase [Paracoccaceae bacterium]